jgi:hypothetical protein
LTNDGGVALLYRFFGRLRLRTLLTQEVRVPQRNTRCSVGEMLRALLYPLLLGLERIETTPLLRQTGVFQDLTGLRSAPESTTPRRFVPRVAPKVARAEFQHATLQTRRHKILLVPAQLRRAATRPSLALPASGFREAAWKHALDRIARLKP